MKVVAFNGSPRRDGNTAVLLRAVLSEIESAGIGTELVQIGSGLVSGCMACYKCAERKDGRCSIEGDFVNECIEKIKHADGVLIGSPTYFSNVSANVKALIDRAGLVAKVNGSMFRRKVGAAVVAVRRAGALHVFNSINHLFLISEMVVVGSSYWNLGIGRLPGEVSSDEEGMSTMRTLGVNMAWTIKKLRAAEK